jgi:hypothetical protein
MGYTLQVGTEPAELGERLVSVLGLGLRELCQGWDTDGMQRWESNQSGVISQSGCSSQMAVHRRHLKSTRRWAPGDVGCTLVDSHSDSHGHGQSL